MVICKLPILLAERKMRVADLIRGTGINKTTLHKLYNGELTRIDLETIGFPGRGNSHDVRERDAGPTRGKQSLSEIRRRSPVTGCKSRGERSRHVDGDGSRS